MKKEGVKKIFYEKVFNMKEFETEKKCSIDISRNEISYHSFLQALGVFTRVFKGTSITITNVEFCFNNINPETLIPSAKSIFFKLN